MNVISFCPTSHLSCFFFLSRRWMPNTSNIYDRTGLERGLPRREAKGMKEPFLDVRAVIGWGSHLPKKKTVRNTWLFSAGFILTKCLGSAVSLSNSCLLVQPPFFKGWFPNHHYFSRDLSSSKNFHDHRTCFIFFGGRASLHVLCTVFPSCHGLYKYPQRVDHRPP